jgi:alkanesulfonate monooxygenase SsuD/methylene tetrahydromethanopterin reductase-like flavin-dependent oxidoreductase (luciferase family)
VLSAPLSIASAIAARTRRIKIGIAVQVLPLCHPLRLAEEAATVDQLSHGRLIFGVGRSGVAQTYEAYGVSYAESRDRFREILDIVEQAWTKPSFSYNGQYHSFKDVAVVPKPYQKPTPPIRIAASTPDTFPAIGRRGAPIFASVRHTTWDDLPRQIQTYHDGSRPSGPRAGLRLGADLSRRDRGARPLRAQGKHHAFLPRAGEPARRRGAAGRPGNRRSAHAPRRPAAQPAL